MSKNSLSNKEAIKLVKDVFQQLERSHSVEDLRRICEMGEIKQNHIPQEKYPSIKFKISETNIKELLTKYCESRNKFDLISDISSRISDPLTKLLYALVWKQGDLPKIHNIIKGISDGHGNNIGEGSLVFHQFGKHLAANDQPIVDQHTLRAYSLYEYVSGDVQDEMIRKIRKTESFKNRELLQRYVDWFRHILSNHSEIEQTRSVIDSIVFATGKTIKTY